MVSARIETKGSATLSRLKGPNRFYGAIKAIRRKRLSPNCFKGDSKSLPTRLAVGSRRARKSITVGTKFVESRIPGTTPKKVLAVGAA